MMNPSPTIGHNQKKHLAEYENELLKIKQLVKRADEHLKGHHQNLHAAIAAIYGTGLKLIKSALLKEFLQVQGERWGKKTKENPFHALVSLAFPEAGEDSKSKYRKILLFAWKEPLSSDDLHERLKNKGVEELYTDAVSAMRNDFDSRYEETTDERLDRALDKIKNQSIGKPVKLAKGISKPASFNGYSTALIRLLNDEIEIVGFIDNQDEGGIKSNISQLIAPESKRACKKLKDKDLYWFFSMADIYSRFVPTTTQIAEWDEAKENAQPPSKYLSDDTFDNLKFIEDIKNRGKKKTMGLERFNQHSVLRFHQCGDIWRAEAISTLPTFAVVQFSFEGWDAIDNTAVLSLFDHQAYSFVNGFLRFSNWKIDETANDYKLTSSENNSENIPLAEFDPAQHPWRIFDSNLKETASFTMSAGDLTAINKWHDSYKQKKIHGRKAPFAQRMEINRNGKELELVFAKNSSERCSFGRFKSDQQELETDSCLIEYKLIKIVTDIARDYGIAFNAVFLSGKEGLSAIQFKAKKFHCDLTITLPLTLSLRGDMAEITRPL